MKFASLAAVTAISFYDGGSQQCIFSLRADGYWEYAGLGLWHLVCQARRFYPMSIIS